MSQPFKNWLWIIACHSSHWSLPDDSNVGFRLGVGQGNNCSIASNGTAGRSARQTEPLRAAPERERQDESIRDPGSAAAVFPQDLARYQNRSVSRDRVADDSKTRTAGIARNRRWVCCSWIGFSRSYPKRTFCAIGPQDKPDSSVTLIYFQIKGDSLNSSSTSTQIGNIGLAASFIALAASLGY